MPSAGEFLSAPKTRSADAFLTTPAAPTPAPAPKSADSFLGPPPAPRASPKPLTAAVDYLKAKGGELAGDYAVRNREARAQMKQGADDFGVRADNPAAGVGGALNLVGGAFNYLASPVNAAIDTVVGRPASKATGGRLQPRDVGDAALAVEGFLVGPKKTGAPRAPEGTTYSARRSGPGYEAIKGGSPTRTSTPSSVAPVATRAAPAATRAAPAVTRAAPSAEDFLAGKKGVKPNADAFLGDDPAALPVPEGHVRLYRGETSDGTKAVLPDWLAESEDVQAAQRAEGRWFAKDQATAEYYNQTFGDKSGRVSYVDVPAEDAARYLATNDPAAKKFASHGPNDPEYFVPPDVAARRQGLPARSAEAFLGDDLAAPPAPRALPAEGSPAPKIEAPAFSGTPRAQQTLHHNAVTDLGNHADRLYRETAPDKLELFVPGGQATDLVHTGGDLFMSDHPNLALGQGANKGVTLEFDAKGLSGRVSMAKPTAQLGYEQGLGSEYVARHNQVKNLKDNLRSFRVSKDIQTTPALRVRLQRLMGQLEKRGWTKTETDGYVQYERPGAAPEPVPTAAAPVVTRSADAFLAGDGLDIPPTPRARTRTMAANEPSRDWEIVGPSTERVGGPVVGGEADAVERVDNALYRMGGHDTADKLEIKQFLKGVPKEISDPEVQEELYHAIEAKMADPNAQIPDHLALAEAYMRPYYEEQTAIINRLRERGDPNIEPFLQDQGYVARRAVGHTPMLDEAGGPRSNRDPIMGGKSLFKKTTAQKKRTAGWVLEDENGNRTFARNPDPAWEHGQVIEGSFGRPMTVKQATTREIEANTDTRYHKNALVNTLDNVARLRRVERNLEVLDEVTTNLKSEGKAWRSQWAYPDPDTGRPTLRRNPTERPEGFVELPHVPQLRDWYFDPKVAEALRDYYPSPNEPLDSVLQKVNRTLTASLFITPIPHALNVAAHWTVGRGWDWMNPGSYRTLAKTGTRAMVDVFTMSRNYQKMLREGSGLMAGDTQVRDFHKLLLEKAGAEFLDDPRAVGAFAKAAGLPVAAIRKVYELSNKALWMSNDIFMLQRQYELEARGMSTRKAIFEAERDIPNYRIPPQVMGSRSVSQWLRDPNIMMFGRYKYGQARAWGVMFKDLVKGTPEQKLDAAGKFLVAALVANVAYPIADAALQHLTGNKDAKLKRSGGFSMTDAAWQVGTGQKDAALGLSSFMSLAPLTSEGIAIAQNHDFFGRPIRQPGSSAPAQALQMGEYAAQNAFYPAGLAMEATKPGPGNAVSALGKLAGLELPAPGKEERKAKYKARDRRSALRHEARDPIEQTIKKGFRKVTGQ